MKLALLAFILISILALSLVTSVHSLIPLANSSSSGNAASNNLNTSEFKAYLDEDFISLLGLSSSIVAVNSSIQTNVSAKEVGFSYDALLSSENGSGAVSLSNSNETIGNQVITILNEKISGETNSSTSYTQTTTTTSKACIQHFIMDYTETNHTGTYSLNVVAESNYTADQSEFLSGTSQIDENFSGPVGTYTSAVTNNNGSLETTITPPNSEGIVSTQNYVKSEAGIPTSPCIFIFAPGLYNSYGMNYGTNDFSPPNYGPVYGYGFFEYWSAQYPAEAGVALSIMSAIGGYFAGIVAILTVLGGPIGIISFLMSMAQWYQCDMDGWWGNYDLVVLYFDVLTFDFFGIQFPIYYEGGIVSNYWMDWSLNQMESNTLTYFPGFMSLPEQVVTLFQGYSGEHTDDWPLFNLIDPPVEINAYDESNNVAVNGIPVWINGQLVGGTGETYYMPDGTYTFSWDGDAFNYLDDNGVAVYGDSASITLSGTDVIELTLNYLYIPTYTVTVYAFDQMDNPVYADFFIDGNWAGTTNEMSVQVPLGIHTIEFSQWDYSGLEMCQDFIDQNNFVYYNTFATLPITCDMTFTGQYLYW